MQIIDDAKASTLREFLLAHVSPGEILITDGWASYAPACEGRYEHRPEPVSPSQLQAHDLLPGVHRVASLAKRWLLGTHQGGVKPAHLQAYLDEFAFRFNRRRSRSRGMLFYRLLEQAVQSPPRTYRSLVADSTAGRRELTPPGPGKRVRPPSLAGEAQDRPWRKSSATAGLSADLLHWRWRTHLRVSGVRNGLLAWAAVYANMGGRYVASTRVAVTSRAQEPTAAAIA